MKLSIIIPVYKVEKFLSKCISSCLDQDLSNDDYEILIVNDGSPDNCLNIAQEFASKNKNITVVSQVNQGLSAARNAGFSIANGEYVWFVDSDDYIEKNCLSRLCLLLTDDVDMLQLQYRLVYDDPNLNKDKIKETPQGVYSGHEVTLMGGVSAPAQFTIYRTEFLRRYGLRFVPGIYHEDSEFKPRVTYLAKKIKFDNEIVYNYYQRPTGSIMSSFSLKRAKDVIFVNNSLYNFCHSFEENIKREFYKKIAMNMNSLFAGYKLLSEQEKVETISLLKANKHLFTCLRKSGQTKYTIEGYAFLLNIQLALVLHKYLK